MIAEELFDVVDMNSDIAVVVAVLAVAVIAFALTTAGRHDVVVVVVTILWFDITAFTLFFTFKFLLLLLKGQTFHHLLAPMTSQL